MIEQIHWLGNNSFLIAGSPIIYINPWRITAPDLPADIVLVGHDGHEYCSPADIAKVRAHHTRVIASASAAAELADCEILRPWQTISLGRASVKGIPTISSSTRRSAAGQSLGFVISINYFDIYYTGETTSPPESGVSQPDILILPISSSDGMTTERAAQFVSRIRPRWTIPCKWDFASRVNAVNFQREVANNSQVVILQPEP
jgi:L-ascorbate metabolism protein UlaG (beta-lactamase superfamily)